MSDYDDVYESEYESEEQNLESKVSQEVLNGSFKINIEIKADDILNAIEPKIRDAVNSFMRSAIGDHVQQMLQPSYYWNKDEQKMGQDLKDAIKQCVREKFDQVYPDAVTNQLNKIVEELKQVTFFTGDSYSKSTEVKSLREHALKKLDELIKAEINPIVKEQSKLIQEQVQNTFAQNFMRALIPLGIERKES